MPNIRHQFEAAITELLRRRTELARAEAEVLRDFNTSLAKFGYRLNAIAMPPVSDAIATTYAGYRRRPTTEPSDNGTQPASEANGTPVVYIDEIEKALSATPMPTPRKRKGHKQIRGHYRCRFCQRMFGYAHHLGRHLRAIHSRLAR